MSRGCIKDLDDNEIQLCQDSDNKSCTVCLSDNCNNESYSLGSKIAASNILLVVAVGVLSRFLL